MARHYEDMYHDLQGSTTAKIMELTWDCVKKAVIEYGRAAHLDTGSLAAQALPRLLTLWFSFTEIKDAEGRAGAPRQNESSEQQSASSSTSSTVSASSVLLHQAKKSLCMEVQMLSQGLGLEKWYPCLPQLVSRCLHEWKETKSVVANLIEKILVAFPKHAVWHVSSLLHSLYRPRKQFGLHVLQAAKKRVMQSSASTASSSKRSNSSSSKHHDSNAFTLLEDAQPFFSNLITLAGLSPPGKEKKMKYRMTPLQAHWIVPTQAALQMVWPKPDTSSPSPHGKTPVTPYFPSDQMRVHRFKESVDVCASKAKPKILTVVTDCGKSLQFLCKRESAGDLRKDERMMGFNTVINRLLTADPEGRRRSLRMRTYSVIILNEECGILEFIPHTATLRSVIGEAHLQIQPIMTFPNHREIFNGFLKFQKDMEFDLEGMAAAYRTHILDWYRPYFHRWFLQRFNDPTEWLEARIRFTQSTAVWSAVGHVLGLGDRHTENMLVAVESAEMCHVDFDCLFDKGLVLQRPEVVPFRLTPNLVDAMGVTGVEGRFRRSMEVTLSVMRENKDSLLGTLEPFLRDPSVAWGRSGRAQKNDAEERARRARSEHHGEREQAEANDALRKVGGRLSGRYNLSHPHADKIHKAYQQRRAPRPSRGLGATREEAAMALSVQGQVQRLIAEATAEQNLCQMYFGWTPWL